MRAIFHIDMDAFFASVEQADNPEYAGKPVVVGSDPKGGSGRGVVSTCSYEARKYGIRSALPISKAYSLCPHAVFVRPRMGRYAQISEGIFEIFNQYTSLVEEVGIDEGFLDCTGSVKLFGTVEEIARRIQRDIYNTYHLTASIGIASNKSVAKIASDLNKPNGITLCEQGKEAEFLAPLSIGKLWGVGKKTFEKLEALHIRTIGDFAALGCASAQSIFGSQGESLWLLARGIDDRAVIPLPAERKSVSEEHTFERDTENESDIAAVMLRMCDAVTSRVRAMGLRGRTCALKIRLEGFETYTRQSTCDEAYNDMATLKNQAMTLYQNFDRKNKRVRLIGVGMTGFESVDCIEKQGSLFPSEKSITRKSDKLLDEMRARFGKKICRGSLVDHNE
jgi:DNA polymerase IV